MTTSFWTKLLDLALPRHCAVCGSRLAPQEGVMCAPCLLHMPRTRFQHQPYDNPMARLFWGRMAIERAAALFFYEPQSELAGMVYDMKYHQQPLTAYHAGMALGAELRGSGFFDGIDAVVPVPIAPSRRRQRGYNQSDELARGLGLVAGLPVCTGVVSRTTFSASQTALTPYQRRSNVEGAFRLDRPARIAGRHLLLVDDVVTTGSTMTACATELLRAPGVRLSVCSLGYTR